MGHLYDARANAHSHPVKKGETLAGIAARYKGQNDAPDDLSWQELALYNWATEDGAEVTRALCERIGSAKADAVQTGAAPDSLLLDPDFGPSAPEPILIPKLWKKQGLELDKKHTITVRRHTPASVVGIKKLDRWFIPQKETCDVEYAASGDPACADQVEFEVYASNYCRLSDWNNGQPKFTVLDGVPVYKSKRAQGETSISDWSGTSNCSEGALSGKDHPLNVAFSPYTVTLRYSKAGSSKAEDKTAWIKLDPFWVRFTKEGKPVPESCKVNWTVEGAGRLKLGLLQISDRTGAVIFAKGLNADDLGKKGFQWDGKSSARTDVTAGGMPYRVQLSGHTDIDDPNGLAVAAMHTEVRLYVHKSTLPLTESDYKAEKDAISLDLSLADVYHKDKEPDRKADGLLWTKYKLALAGFHPGPVTDATANDHFKKALHEFQRSVPKAGGSPGKYQRMSVGDGQDEVKNADDALEDLHRDWHRPWFGKPADAASKIDLNWKPSDWPGIPNQGNALAPDALLAFRDPKKRMIIWVNDRNWYTDGEYWHNPFYSRAIPVPPEMVAVTQHNLDAVHNDSADLGGANISVGRGSFEHRDKRVEPCDARDIARPWIPLQAGFRLLGKNQQLDDEVAEPGEYKEIEGAIGPLRVDWTMDEIDKPDSTGATNFPVLDPEIDGILRLLYHPERGRTRIALRWALNEEMAKHDRVDPKKTSYYYNAPFTCGGIRPDAVADYFKAPFGLDGDSLAPWTAKPSSRQSVLSVVHDRLGQPDESVFRKRLGRAGVYFHPSRIAGDGYQVRAQVRFDQKDGYDFPNAKVLEQRYEKPPQAHTAEFRLWRKTSIRGYVKWGKTDSWSSAAASPVPHLPDSGPEQWRAYYTACYVHVSNECNASNAELVQDIKQVFPQPDDYRAVVLDALDPADLRVTDVSRQNWTQFSADYCWPWANHKHLGMDGITGDFGAAKDDLVFQGLMTHVFITFRMSLEIVKAIERLTGRMRGHVLVEHQTSDDITYRWYKCPTCNERYTYMLKATDLQGMSGEDCPANCGDKLEALDYYKCKCSSCDTTFFQPGPLVVGQQCSNCGRTTTLTAAMERVEIPREEAHGRTVHGVYSPSCGYPVGVFWNSGGCSSLWAHEMGHNRHFEHAASAPKDDRTSAAGKQHDNEGNAITTFHADEVDKNKNWDRACLMSYVEQCESTGRSTGHKKIKTYNENIDRPCFCFKCVLWNRGWKVDQMGNPVGTLKDL